MSDIILFFKERSLLVLGIIFNLVLAIFSMSVEVISGSSGNNASHIVAIIAMGIVLHETWGVKK